MKAIIVYSEEFDQLAELRSFFKKNKISFDEIITSFDEFPVNKIDNYDLLVIQDQLAQSDPQKKKTHPGIEILRDLRAKSQSGIPAVLITNEKFEDLEEEMRVGKGESEIHYLNMIYSPGLKIFSMQEKTWNLNPILNMRPLSNALVTDICEMLLELKGYLDDRILHKLRFIPKNEDESQNSIEELNKNLQWIRNYLNQFFTSGEIIRVEYEKLSNQLVYAQKDYDEKEFYNLLSQLRGNIKREISARNKIVLEGLAEKRYRILLLDDDPSWMKKIMEPLEENFDLITTQKASEAIEILNEDQSNDIVAVISDWRLYKDFKRQNIWQDMQGYDVLEYAAHNGYRALIALTSLTDSVIHKIRNKLNVSISLITKDFVGVEDNAELVRNIIFDKCAEVVSTIAGMPPSKGWTNGGEQSLHSQYIELRSSGDWAIAEEEISLKADEVLKYYLQATDIDYLRSLEPIDRKFGLNLQKKGVYLLENCLVIRRVWLALWWNLNEFEFSYALDEYPEVKIFSIIRQRFLDEEAVNFKEGLEKLGNSAKQLAYNLGIVKEELPLKGILPEEKIWLKNKGINVDQGNVSVYEW